MPYIMARDFAPTLGERLADARRAAGLTQQQVANSVGANLNSIGRWETGETDITAANLVRYAKACGTTVAALTEGL